MSVILKSGEAISRSQVNNSLTKQMYSFPKAARFPIQKEWKEPKDNKTGKTDQYYTLPEVRSKRTTTMGYGNRVDFTLSQKGVNTKFYSFPTDFDPVHPHGPRYSMANGRERYKRVYVEGQHPDDPNVPGAGKYFMPKPFGMDGLKFTMRGRNDDSKGNDKENKENNDKKKNVFPGPGEYGIAIKINEKGKYPVSNITNVSSMKFGDKERKRFNYKYSPFPGPGEYDSKPLIGKIFDSRFRSYTNGNIYGKYKIVDSRSNYPGPGSYRLPSDFGQYESKDADKYPTENVYPVKKIPFEEKAWRHNMKVKKEPEIDYQDQEEVEDKKPIDERGMDGNEDENKEGNEGENIEGNEGENKEGNEGENKEGNEGENKEGNEGENTADNKEAEEKPDENKGVEDKPTEEKPTEEKPTEEKPTEEKGDEKGAEEAPQDGDVIGDYMEKEEEEEVKPKDQEQQA